MLATTSGVAGVASTSNSSWPPSRSSVATGPNLAKAAPRLTSNGPYVFSGFFAFLICARLWFAGPFFSLFGSPAIVRFLTIWMTSSSANP